MERYVFIHGSSVGQSSYIPSNAPQSICGEIADSYFKGRELRCKESDAGTALFVELCKNAQGGGFVCYSFVNNRCEGFPTNDGKGRTGQYFAISILSQEYVFPEPVYNLFHSAYKQLFEGKIIDKEGRFLVRQFDEKKEELQKSIEQIDKFFGEFSQSRRPRTGFQPADYISWKGEKLSPDICNSEATFETLCKLGRIYVSSEYGSPSAKIQLLENNIKTLQQQKDELEEKINNVNSTNRIKSNKELEDVRRTLADEEAKTKRLQTENERYKESLKVVKTELEKYGKLGESIHSLQNQHSRYGKKGKKDLLKILLLVLVLIFTLISSILSYAFFRSLPSNPKDGKTTEKTEQTQDRGENESETKLGVEKESGNESEIVQLSFEVSDNGKLEFGAEEKKTKSITITTNGTWACPSVPTAAQSWIELSKSGDNLNVKVKEANHEAKDRTVTIIVSSTLANQSLEKQITITQKKKKEETQPKDYGLMITNASGVELKKGDLVKQGEKLKAKVTKKATSSTGWTVDGCTDNGNGTKNNLNEVNLTVNASGGESVTISYGSNTNPKQRQTVTLTVKNEEIETTQIDSTQNN